MVLPESSSESSEETLFKHIWSSSSPKFRTQENISIVIIKYFTFTLKAKTFIEI